MIGRCKNPKSKGYDRYGGAGITVCEKWNIFENFFNDMGERPPGMTLDRINNHLGYDPDNCRWATWREQEGNRKNNRRVIIAGNSVCFAEAARLLGGNIDALVAKAALVGDDQKTVDLILMEILTSIGN